MNVRHALIDQGLDLALNHARHIPYQVSPGRVKLVRHPGLVPDDRPGHHAGHCNFVGSVSMLLEETGFVGCEAADLPQFGSNEPLNES